MFRRPFGLYRSRNPWREIEHMQREIGRIFDDASRSRLAVAPSFPAMNVWSNEEGVVITAELPGVSPDDIDISVVGDMLTLSGGRQPQAPENIKYHRRERGQGKFTRTFQLPFMVEANKVEAFFDKGILHISLPRAEAEKPKKIAVKAA